MMTYRIFPTSTGHSLLKLTFLLVHKWETSSTRFWNTCQQVQNPVHLCMDKLQLTGRYLGRVFNSISGRIISMCLLCLLPIRPNLELQTWHKQLLGYLPLVIAFSKFMPWKMLHSPSAGFKAVCRLKVQLIFPQSPIRTTQLSVSATRWQHGPLISHWNKGKN